MEAKLFNTQGENKGSVELAEGIYGRTPREGLLHEVVVAHLANQRGGNAHTKTRSEVSGGGRKPWKQKGTGRARHGSIRSPIWRGGGVAFGPRNDVNWRQELPKKKLKTALAQALSKRQAEGRILVLEDLKLEEGKTRRVVEIVSALKLEGRVLFVLDAPNAEFSRASRNLQDVQWTTAANLNTYDALVPAWLIFTKAGLEAIEKRWS